MMNCLGVVFSVAVLASVAPSDTAKSAFDRGEKALAADKLDDAAAAYKEALSATPGYAAAMNGLGSVLFKKGKRDEAIAQFRGAVDADPDFKLAYFNLGYAARKTSDFATAAKAYEKYTQLDPADADGFYGLGESYRQLGDSTQAISAYEAYLAKEQRPSEQKWIDKAKEYLAQLKSQPAKPPPAPAPKMATAPSSGAPNPTLAKTQIAEGDRLMQDRKYREASLAYQDAVNADGGNIEALFKLGNAYAVLGYYAQAIDRWNKVSQLSSDPAIKKSADDNIAKARAKLAQAGGGSPQAVGALPGSGPVADSTREKARQAYEQGVKSITSRDYNGAISSLSQAIQFEPTLSVAYVARGSAFIGTRRFAEAAADYQYALRLDGRLASPLYGLGEAYRGMGRSADARQYYEKYGASSASDVRPELQTEAKQKADKLR